MIRYHHKKVNLEIPANSNLAQERIHLPAGVCVGMAAVAVSADPNEFVDLSVLDGGSEIVEGSDYRFYKKTNAGKWVESLRPMSFNCNRVATVQLSAYNNLPDGFKLQVIFVIVEQIS